MATPQLGIFLTETQSVSQSQTSRGNAGSQGASFEEQFSQLLGQYVDTPQGTGSPQAGSELPPEMNALMTLNGAELPEGFLAELQSKLEQLFGELGDLESLTEEQLQQAFDDISQQILDVSGQFGLTLSPASVTSFIQNLAQGSGGTGGADVLFANASYNGQPINSQLLNRAPGAAVSMVNLSQGITADSTTFSLAQNSPLESLQLLKQSVESQNFSSSSVVDGLKSMLSSTAATSMSVSLDDVAANHQASVSLYSQPQASAVEDAEVNLQRIPVPPSNRQFSQELSERIMVMATKNIQHAEIQLTPPELGSLMVKINVESDQASIVFTSPNNSVREALEQQSFRLREMLEQQGMDLVDVDVSDQQQDSRSNTNELVAEMNAKGAHNDEHEAETFLESLDQQKAVTASLRLVDYYA
ncbi:flagellar hook-length control protein FliK [Litoribrevibacter albus]|uniref:Flagellar hook-length control protein-like C-terminal domain-containing protein n=1 Tax=Litoribrevibacter albus TaxID=1473156 RepID=A0AA37SDF8_9GAMM|nr:flagellar hook-length control protein FliK [Litoribrevibacter albus]GLQ32343.1 hypothetical protein GCM10007876_28220 [Litoribrevibacter albus]